MPRVGIKITSPAFLTSGGATSHKIGDTQPIQSSMYNNANVSFPRLYAGIMLLHHVIRRSGRFHRARVSRARAREFEPMASQANDL